MIINFEYNTDSYTYQCEATFVQLSNGDWNLDDLWTDNEPRAHTLKCIAEKAYDKLYDILEERGVS